MAEPQVNPRFLMPDRMGFRSTPLCKTCLIAGGCVESPMAPVFMSRAPFLSVDDRESWWASPRQIKHCATEVKVIGSGLTRPVTVVSEVAILVPVVQATPLIGKKWAKELERSRANPSPTLILSSLGKKISLF